MAVTIEKMFDFPGPQPNGMQATEEGIWFLDQVSNQALLVSYEGETLKAIDTDSEHGSGVTVDGTNLWLASTFVPTRIEADGPAILKVDPETGKDPRLLSNGGCPAVRGPRIGVARWQVMDGSTPISDRLPARPGKRSRCSTLFPSARGPSARSRVGGG